jgi:hypothetical protein
MAVINHGLKGVSVLSALLLAGGVAAGSASARSKGFTARQHPRAGRLQGRRGAFASQPLRSRNGLLRLLQSDAAFRKRLARHFRTTEAGMVSWARENLVLFRLRFDVTRTVHGVGRDGRPVRVRQRLPKGTPVFGLPEGYAVLKEVCGNPVATTLPPLASLVRTRPPSAQPPPIASAPMVTLPAGVIVARVVEWPVSAPIDSVPVESEPPAPMVAGSLEEFRATEPSIVPDPVAPPPRPNTPPVIVPPIWVVPPSDPPDEPEVPEVPDVPEGPGWLLLLGAGLPLVVAARRTIGTLRHHSV